MVRGGLLKFFSVNTQAPRPPLEGSEHGFGSEQEEVSGRGWGRAQSDLNASQEKRHQEWLALHGEALSWWQPAAKHLDF